MLDSKGFDLWAEEYDKSVGLSNDDGTYPFAGYRDVLGTIYAQVLGSGAKSVLDLGFGTGTLTTRLYEAGCTIYGQDFSPEMVKMAQAKMTNATLVIGDFAKFLDSALTTRSYDAIVATYSLHHLTDVQKVDLLKHLLPLLNEGGCIYIGDVAFETRRMLEELKEEAEDLWDDEEIYFVFEELKKEFPNLEYQQMSCCAGLFTLRP